MANIVVNDIKLAGAELFSDYETFISDLEENELELRGGLMIAYCSCAGICGGGPVYA